MALMSIEGAKASFGPKLTATQLLNKHIALLEKEIKERSSGIFGCFTSFFTPNELNLKRQKLEGLNELKKSISTISTVEALNAKVEDISKNNSKFLSGFWRTGTSDIIKAFRNQFDTDPKQSDREIPLRTLLNR